MPRWSTDSVAPLKSVQVVDWAASHPEVRQSPIEAPLMIVGMPRTGTTALSHLLAADPANRSLLAWEPALWACVRHEGVEPTNDPTDEQGRRLRTEEGTESQFGQDPDGESAD